MQYRREVDGLRAVAILPVLFFHADLLSIHGGFLGVDVFFVISGYLITSILLDEIKKDRFSIVRFYERRARRIMPALSLVLIFSTLGALIFLPPQPMKEFSQSLVSVMAFASNIYFYLTSGYFSPNAEDLLLLHTWSLAIEEQFYIFFPLLLLLLKANKKLLQGSIFIIFLASLAYSIYLTNRDPSASFYLLPTRAWELLMGSIVAMYYVKAERLAGSVKELLSAVGLVALLGSYYLIDHSFSHPGWPTVIPVAATAIIIAFSNGTLVARLLSFRPFVYIGLISYSLYLWHQPLFALLRQKSIGTPEPALYVMAMAVVFAVSALSYRYVESPFRNRSRVSRKVIFTASAAAIVFFSSVGLVGHISSGLQARYAKDFELASVEHSPKRKGCHTSGQHYLSPEQACSYFDGKVTWATLGDSHMVELAYALAQELKTQQLGVKHLSFSACVPAYTFDIAMPGCSNWLKDSVAYLNAADEIEHVAVGFRYATLFPAPEIPHSKQPLGLGELNRAEVNEAYWQSLKSLIEALSEAGKQVYLIYPIPELPLDIKRGSFPFSIFHTTPWLNLGHASEFEQYAERNQFVLQRFEQLQSENVHKVKSFNVICPQGICPAEKDGRSLYFDDDHLSLYGAGLLAQELLRQ
ncbi:acyltransferase [Neiella marina]|uniref:Acyltransferase n=1 Tax=Neiella holothuriorum TaxID=2870530 RepID=A0ABS7EH31_9GAMM|nr:acyltransferase family protein [Neiella holothuriorum]MBW8191635.1 acyltransferase [Neiella holothuriorum]